MIEGIGEDNVRRVSAVAGSGKLLLRALAT